MGLDGKYLRDSNRADLQRSAFRKVHFDPISSMPTWRLRFGVDDWRPLSWLINIKLPNWALVSLSRYLFVGAGDDYEVRPVSRYHCFD
jgi:hypothetical protein